ncbi:PLP-dependent aminotransferase family protein [Chryseobacterium wangxinyae]|uniref:MocR-like pyridoxine biosynthesis transcription factor PdxR n=1 Tax=Chryseobacterium sp. CY350 TaxID=2997336 RepID=UPI0022713B02|nr:PLP-dependent aminotransferase family protein [Chryseobacterium sp. CY350]MCY0977196.1 PLP-dependent aminotransferase family protein [Chryseobacterium sp. CY350]WBZ95783.1 PLP-dependent aminotransferase family protein [Chryseobacterium sp. CY350]
MLRPWKIEIRLNHQSNKAIYIQIADAIIADIKSGRLARGNALPGSRSLAETLGVNRNTIIQALNVLLSEEWLISKQRKGTFVADIIPSELENKTIVGEGSKEEQKTIYRITFDDGYPDSKIAPVDELAKAYRQTFSRSARWKMMGYSNPFGDPDFIQAIVDMLNHQRGMTINKNSICITRGSQMAMYLTAQSLFEKDDIVLVEDPGYQPAWKAFEKAGAKLLPVRIDKEGLVTEDIIHHIAKNKRIKAIYTTPHHQYPTTVTMSLQRRHELVRLSNEHGFTIIEDDYDNEFHYGYRPILPLSSNTELKNYIYIGTMSKVVAPALRIGYLASSNPEVIKKIGELRTIIDVQGDGIMEKAVLQLINDGTIKRHIRKATTHYKVKRNFFDELLKRYLDDQINYSTPDGGLAFWIEPKKEINWSSIDKILKKNGIKIITPDNYSNVNKVNGLRIGFGSLSQEDLEIAVEALSKVL